MKILLTTTAMSFALGVANLAVASVSFAPTDSVHKLEVLLAPNVETTTSLTAETETFYRGDFLISANSKLEGLTQSDLYSGAGAAEARTVRWVT